MTISHGKPLSPGPGVQTLRRGLLGGRRLQLVREIREVDKAFFFVGEPLHLNKGMFTLELVLGVSRFRFVLVGVDRVIEFMPGEGVCWCWLGFASP